MAGFAPPHWRRGGSQWDQGYEITGYFLDWIDKRYGAAPNSPDSQTFVAALNETMRDASYDEKVFEKLTGKAVEKLWEEYISEFKGDETK